MEITADDLVDIAQIARDSRVPYATAYRWTQHDTFPVPRLRVGRVRMWSLSLDVRPWVEQWYQDHRGDRRMGRPA